MSGDTQDQAAAPATETPDEYAVIEVFGHRRHVGRILEVERFGTKLCRVDVPKDGKFESGFTSHFYGGSSIFSMTPCDLATVERANRPYQAAGALSYREEEPDDDPIHDETETEDEEALG